MFARANGRGGGLSPSEVRCCLACQVTPDRQRH